MANNHRFGVLQLISPSKPRRRRKSKVAPRRIFALTGYDASHLNLVRCFYMSISRYVAGEYSQVELPDESRLLISIGGNDVRLKQLWLLGIFSRTLATLSVPVDFQNPLWRSVDGSNVLYNLQEEIDGCASLPEAIRIFSQHDFTKERTLKGSPDSHSELLKKYNELGVSFQLSTVALEIGNKVIGDNPVLTGAYASGYLLREAERRVGEAHTFVGAVDKFSNILSVTMPIKERVMAVADFLDGQSTSLGMVDMHVPYMYLSTEEINGALEVICNSYLDKLGIEDENKSEVVARNLVYGYLVHLAEDVLQL